MWQFLSGACRYFKGAGSAQLPSTYGDVRAMSMNVVRPQRCGMCCSMDQDFSLLETFVHHTNISEKVEAWIRSQTKTLPHQSRSQGQNGRPSLRLQTSMWKEAVWQGNPSTAFIFIYIHCNKLQYVRVRAAVLLDGETNFTQRDFFRFFILKPISFKMLNLKRV